MEENNRILPIEIAEEMKKSYIDYSMSVIVGRALPDVRDGLKPVHRRILYSMSELNLTPDKPYRKSARIVGDVLGKYHPHGDTAVYHAMVRMAQDFSTRGLLVDGHGNFGSVDGDAPAAMRYTEAKMTKLSIELLRDIEGTMTSLQKFIENNTIEGQETISYRSIIGDETEEVPVKPLLGYISAVKSVITDLFSSITTITKTFNNLQIKSISYLNRFYSQQMDYMYG